MMKTMIAVTLALAALMLGLDKVRNEHAMTREYRRQADALERIADSAQITAQLRDKKDRVTVAYGAPVHGCDFIANNMRKRFEQIEVCR
jgi:hypothetical protein